MTSRSETLAEIDAALVEWDSVTVARDPAAAAVANALRKARALIPDPTADDDDKAMAAVTGAWLGPWFDGNRPSLADLLFAAGFRRHEPSPVADAATSNGYSPVPVTDADGRSYEYHQIQLPASVIYVPEARQA